MAARDSREGGVIAGATSRSDPARWQRRAEVSAGRRSACAAFDAASRRLWDALRDLSTATVDLGGGDGDRTAVDDRRRVCDEAAADLRAALDELRVVLPRRRSRPAGRVWSALEVVRVHAEGAGVVPDEVLLDAYGHYEAHLHAVRRHRGP